jgi:hypothetical protein
VQQLPNPPASHSDVPHVIFPGFGGTVEVVGPLSSSSPVGVVPASVMSVFPLPVPLSAPV